MAVVAGCNQFAEVPDEHMAADGSEPNQFVDRRPAFALGGTQARHRIIELGHVETLARHGPRRTGPGQTIALTKGSRPRASPRFSWLSRAAARLPWLLEA